MLLLIAACAVLLFTKLALVCEAAGSIENEQPAEAKDEAKELVRQFSAAMSWTNSIQDRRTLSNAYYILIM